MNALWAAVRRQPVRAYVYGVLVPGEALAVSYGLVTGDQAALWMALAAALLVVPGAELARAKVTPLADPRDNLGRRLTAMTLPPRYEFGTPRRTTGERPCDLPGPHNPHWWADSGEQLTCPGK